MIKKLESKKDSTLETTNDAVNVIKNIMYYYRICMQKAK